MQTTKKANKNFYIEYIRIWRQVNVTYLLHCEIANCEINVAMTTQHSLLLLER